MFRSRSRGNMMLHRDMNRGTGFWQMLKCKEENLRILVLGVAIYIYLALGALMFQAVEEFRDNEMRTDWKKEYGDFLGRLPPHHNETEEDGREDPHGGTSSSTTLSPSSSDGNNGSSSHPRNMNATHILVSRLDLEDFLDKYATAVKAGYGGVRSRDKWDYRGSFHYAWTIVSTIGYGAMSPGTFLGKMLTIIYALGGVASGLLFFNLYLERIITFITTCMRGVRSLRQRRRPSVYATAPTANTDPTSPLKSPVGGRSGPNNGNNSSNSNDKLTAAARAVRRASQSSAENESALELQDWKPSVQSVLLCLLSMSASYIFLSALVFKFMEAWSYFDSLYFCFVSFATIGFGDLVILQQKEYVSPWVETAYHIVAFFIIGHGCCLIYSLLNVISIGIKQILNWIIKRMDCRWCFTCFHWSSNSIRRKVSTRRSRRRRSRMSRRGAGRNVGDGSMGTGRGQRGGGASNGKRNAGKVSVIDVMDVSSGGNHPDEETRNSISESERRPSGDMVSIRGDLSNKVNLVVMQKILSESAQSHRSAPEVRQTFSATSVGPLAIASEKLADSSFMG